MKSIIFEDRVMIIFSDGSTKVVENPDEELLNLIEQNDEEKVAQALHTEPPIDEASIMANLEGSEILTRRGAMVIMPEVSTLSLPADFITKILSIEKSGDKDELQKYINFWRLISLNPDSRVRDNIFWFIRRWGMEISQAGFIICYRNVDVKNEGKFTDEQIEALIESYYLNKYLHKLDPALLASPLEGYTSLEEAYNKVVNEQQGSAVYTDNYTHSFQIQIGKPVTMDRRKCNSNQEDSCSYGLHVGAKGWLKNNYCGKVTLQALVNPANVVAVPTIDNYGKMRTCEYLPTGICHFENDVLIEPSVSIETDIKYLSEVSYDGQINNIDDGKYIIFDRTLTREKIFKDILNSISLAHK